MKIWASTPKGKKHFKRMNRLSHTPEAEAKRSKSITKWSLERYKKNPNLGKEITKKAHEKTRKMVKDGTHAFLNPKIRKKAMKVLSSKNYGGTWIEKKMGWLLGKLGIKKESQKAISYGNDSWGRPKYIFGDWFLPDYDLIIECDGEYFYSNEYTNQRHQAYPIQNNQRYFYTNRLFCRHNSVNISFAAIVQKAWARSKSACCYLRRVTSHGHYRRDFRLCGNLSGDALVEAISQQSRGKEVRFRTSHPG